MARSGLRMDMVEGAAGFPGCLLHPALCVPRVYLDPVPEDLRCPICFDGAVSCKTSCKHRFCFSCIQYHVSNRYRQSMRIDCPLCRGLITAHSVVPVEVDMQDKALELRVSCYGAENGCDYNSQVKDILVHELHCGQVGVVCKYRSRGCLQCTLRKDIDAHENSCRYNPLVQPCMYMSLGCRVRGTKELLDAHTPRCRSRKITAPVPCPNKHLGCELYIPKKFETIHGEQCLFKLLAEREPTSICERNHSMVTRSTGSSVTLDNESARPNNKKRRIQTRDENTLANSFQNTITCNYSQSNVTCNSSQNTINPNSFQSNIAGTPTHAGEGIHCKNESSALSNTINTTTSSCTHSSADYFTVIVSCRRNKREKALANKTVISRIKRFIPNVKEVELDDDKEASISITDMCPCMIPGIQHAIRDQYSPNLALLGLKCSGFNVCR